MFCKYCGSKIGEGENFCRSCGSPVTNPVEEVKTEVEVSVGSEPMPIVVSTTKTDKSGKNVVLIVILSILAVFGLIFLVIFGVAFYEVMTEEETDNSGNDYNTNQSISTKTINYNNYKVEVPSNYTTEIKDNQLQITGNTGDWRASISYVEVNFQNMVSNSAYIKTYYENLGYTIGAVEYKKLSGVNCLTIEASYNGEYAILGIIEADSNHVFAIGIDSLRASYDWNALEESVGIMSTAVYDYTSSSSGYGADISGATDFGPIFN